MNKVLIVTYYWPPSSGSGVQRWLKFVKYLPSFGWTPYVVTPEAPEFTIQDATLAKDIPAEATVIHLPIWEPNALFFKLNKLRGANVSHADVISTGKKGIFKKLASWIRGNFFIPDARVFWVKPAVKFLKGFIHEQKIGIIITTGPPHSMHVIGLNLKKQIPSLQWIADFRDPWSEWDLLDTFSLSERSRRRHRELERDVLTTADRVITIAPYHVARFEHLGKRKVDLITNGFDESDFPRTAHRPTAKFTVTHVGIVDELRDPRPVMLGLNEVISRSPEMAAKVVVRFIGNVNRSFKDFVSGIPALSEVVEFIPHMPHPELLKAYQETDVQLLVLAHTVIAPGNLPGKFFEYLASGNPILGTGPVDGDAAKILKETGAGEIYERTDAAGIQAAWNRFYERWQRGERPQNQHIERFTRKNLTGQLVALLTTMTNPDNR